MNEAVIVSACRTPIGSFGGKLSTVVASKLGAIVIEESLRRAAVSKDVVDEVIMGNVLTAGEGQAPARQAAIFAGLPASVECLTVNKVCGSGMKAIMLGSQAIQLGDADVVVAGGMESMSNTPYLLEKARNGYKMGNGELIDSMIRDGLWDVYNNFHMGNAAELCAKECAVPREDQDQFAILSYRRSQESQAQGRFKDEIVKVGVQKMRSIKNLFVLFYFFFIFILLLDTHLHNFIVKASLSLRLLGAPVTEDRKLILFISRNSAFLGAKFCGIPHVEIVVHIPQPILDHRINKLCISHLVAVAGFLQ